MIRGKWYRGGGEGGGGGGETNISLQHKNIYENDE